MKIKFEPVRWMAGALTALTALIGANELFHVLPPAWTPYLLFAEALLTLLLGREARKHTTALANPKTADGQPAILLPK